MKRKQKTPLREEIERRDAELRGESERLSEADAFILRRLRHHRAVNFSFGERA